MILDILKSDQRLPDTQQYLSGVPYKKRIITACNPDGRPVHPDTRLEIASLHRKLISTVVYVTHDQVEAMTLAVKIVVLQGGRVEQIGSPMDLF